MSGTFAPQWVERRFCFKLELIKHLLAFTSAPGRCFAVPNQTAVSRAFRGMAGLLSSVAELVVSDVGSIDTRTDIQQANGLLLAQESAAVCAGGGGWLQPTKFATSAPTRSVLMESS